MPMLTLPPTPSYSDQVHTTGMDVPQPLGARAALTLGKDMTFRDFAQGAFRMRGIGRGQSIELLIAPEVQRLIDDTMAEARPSLTGGTGGGAGGGEGGGGDGGGEGGGEGGGGEGGGEMRPSRGGPCVASLS